MAPLKCIKKGKYTCEVCNCVLRKPAVGPCENQTVLVITAFDGLVENAEINFSHDGS